MAETKEGVTQVTKNETTEVLDTRGNTLGTHKALENIFDKIEQGSKADDAIKDVMTPTPKEETADAGEEQKQVEQQAPIVNDLDRKLNETQQQKQDDAKEVKPELKTEDKDAVLDEELQVLPHDKPKTAKRIQAFLKKIESIQSEKSQTKKELDEKAQRLADYEKRLAEVKPVDPKTEEAMKKAQEELSMFRRRYQLDQDPDVKARFDDRVQESEKPIADILNRNGAGDMLVKIIQDEGGWLKFSQSNRKVSLKDGDRPASEVAELILENLPFADRKTVESISTDQITTKRERERFFQDEIKKANEYFKKRDDETAQLTQSQQRQLEETKKEIENWTKDIQTKTDWLKPKDIPATANASEKAAVEEDNKYTRQLNDLLTKNLNVKDVKGMLEIVHESVQLYQERRVHAKTQAALKSAQTELDRVKKDLDKVRNGNRSVPRAGSIASQPAIVSNTNSPEKHDIESAFNAIMEKKMSGED